MAKGRAFARAKFVSDLNDGFGSQAEFQIDFVIIHRLPLPATPPDLAAPLLADDAKGDCGEAGPEIPSSVVTPRPPKRTAAFRVTRRARADPCANLPGCPRTRRVPVPRWPNIPHGERRSRR